MARKFLRSVESSYELETNKPTDSVQLGTEIAQGDRGGYDREAFYLRATDYDGHCKNIQTALPTTYGTAIEMVVESDHTPYRTPGEAARNWMVHGIVRDLELYVDKDDPVARAFLAEIEMERSIELLEGQTRYVTNLAVACEKQIAARNWRPLSELLFIAEEVELPQSLTERRDDIVKQAWNRTPDERDW